MQIHENVEGAVTNFVKNEVFVTVLYSQHPLNSIAGYPSIDESVRKTWNIEDIEIFKVTVIDLIESPSLTSIHRPHWNNYLPIIKHLKPCLAYDAVLL